MKANQQARNNTKAASSVVGTMLILPISVVIISAIFIWSGDLVNYITKMGQQLENDAHTIVSVNTTYQSEPSSKGVSWAWYDDFEEELTWDIVKNNLNPSTSTVNPYHEDHYDKDGHSAEVISGSDADTYAGIIKPFQGRKYDEVSIELAFTINESNDPAIPGSLEEYKIFNISQNDEKNCGKIKINIDGNGNNLYYYNITTNDFVEFASNIPLTASDYCWHHMKLVVNFEANNNSRDAHYVSFILDGIKYNLSKHDLANNDPIVKTNPQRINVYYISKNIPIVGAQSISYIDDFKIKAMIK